jgi:hypothetical protein
MVVSKSKPRTAWNKGKTYSRAGTKNAERDEKIRELTKQGLSASEVGAIVGCSRNAVVSVWKRDRDKGLNYLPARSRTQVGQASSLVDKARRSRKTKAEYTRDKGRPFEINRGPKPKTAPGALPVDGSPPEGACYGFEARTGCAWPYGDRAPFHYCNRPCCKVTAFGAEPHTTAYCDDHWKKRRTSTYSRIIEPMR